MRDGGSARRRARSRSRFPPELWDRPRSAAGGDGAARRSGRPWRAWLAQPAARLVVHHGPGQESLLQAEEIRSWLTALALEAERVTLRNDLKAGEPLQLEVYE